MALLVIERNLSEQLQRSRDAARRVTEINRDIGVVMRTHSTNGANPGLIAS